MIDVADFSMQQTLQLQKRHKTSNELAASARNTNTNLIFFKKIEINKIGKNYVYFSIYDLENTVRG